MKQVILIRHAKSSWKDISLEDLQRPIKKSAVTKAQSIAKDLAKHKFTIDLMVTSPAKRTIETAHLFAKELKYTTASLVINEKLYESSKEDIIKVIADLDNALTTVALVGHDPSLCDFFNYFTGKTLEKIPTSGCTVLKFQSTNWKINTKKKAEIVYFNYPKKKQG